MSPRKKLGRSFANREDDRCSQCGVHRKYHYGGEMLPHGACPKFYEKSEGYLSSRKSSK